MSTSARLSPPRAVHGGLFSSFRVLIFLEVEYSPHLHISLLAYPFAIVLYGIRAYPVYAQPPLSPVLPLHPPSLRVSLLAFLFC